MLGIVSNLMLLLLGFFNKVSKPSKVLNQKL